MHERGGVPQLDKYPERYVDRRCQIFYWYTGRASANMLTEWAIAHPMAHVKHYM